MKHIFSLKMICRGKSTIPFCPLAPWLVIVHPNLYASRTIVSP